MKLVQLVYRSVAAPGLSEHEVVRILKKSQEKNHAKRLSGLLVYREHRFLQLLEGAESEVMGLFEQISRDPRHTKVEVLWVGTATKVAMPTWAMAYVSPTLPDTERSHNGFVLSEEDARQICEALPEHLGTPFLAVLPMECEALA